MRQRNHPVELIFSSKKTRRVPVEIGTPVGPYRIKGLVGDNPDSDYVVLECKLVCGFERKVQRRQLKPESRDTAACHAFRRTGVNRFDKDKAHPAPQRVMNSHKVGLCPRCQERERRPGGPYCSQCQTIVNRENAAARKARLAEQAAE